MKEFDDKFEPVVNEISQFLNCEIKTASLYYDILKSPKYEDELISTCSNKDDLIQQLDYLGSLCLISDYAERNKRILFFPIDPQFSFSAIILKEMWQLDTNLHTIQDLIERMDLIELNQRYISCKNIIKQIKVFYNQQLPFLKEMAVVVKGNSRIATSLSGILDTAEKDIYAVVSPPHLLGEIVWHTVSEKMNEGVMYNRVTIFDELVRHGFAICRNEVLNYNENLYVSKSKELPQKFYVINNITVVFFIPDSANKDFKLEVQIITNEGVAQRYIDIYKKMVDYSYNVIDLIDKIAIYRSNIISKSKSFLSDDELKWFVDVFDYGVYCKHENYPTDIFNTAKNKCFDKDLIIQNSNNEIIAKYGIKEVLENG